MVSDALLTHKSKIDNFTCELQKEVVLTAPYIRFNNSTKPQLTVSNDLLTRATSGTLYQSRVFCDRWIIEFELLDCEMVVTCPTVGPLSERDSQNFNTTISSAAKLGGQCVKKA